MLLREYLFRNALASEYHADELETYVELLDSIQIGDEMEFGTYILPPPCSHPDYTVSAPLRWKVIDIREDKILLLSSVLVYSEFFDGNNPIFGPINDTSWAISTIRESLNGSFFERTFIESEASVICETLVSTPPNPTYGTEGGEAVTDRLFLLSADEVKDIISDGRVHDITAEIIYADKDYYGRSDVELLFEYMPWWLRTTGCDQKHVAVVSEDGTIDLEGIRCTADEVGIRPAMWIDVEKIRHILDKPE